MKKIDLRFSLSSFLTAKDLLTFSFIQCHADEQGKLSIRLRDLVTGIGYKVKSGPNQSLERMRDILDYLACSHFIEVKQDVQICKANTVIDIVVT